MAEVKTYKCDICGKVYHVDDNDEKVMTINYKVDNENEGKFEHICNKCMSMIHQFILDPNYMDCLKEDLGKNVELKHKFASCVSDIYRKVCSGGEWRPIWGCGVDTEEQTKEIIEAYDELEKSCRVWRIVASMGIGAFIGNMLALLLKLFV